MGNLMKEAGKYFKEYPQWLEWLRAMCRFFRIQHYRTHLVRVLRNVVQDDEELDLAPTLKYFTASFAKWRYETLHHCLESLLALRILCQRYMRRELFGAVEDVELLQTVLRACASVEFWQWIACSFTVIYQPLEHLRRWGMVCSCHEQERREQRCKIDCPRNGRRLRESHNKICVFAVGLQQRANALDLEAAEGNPRLHTQLVNASRAVAVGVLTRCGYLGVIPWAISRADTPDGAREVLKQYADKPDSQHDPLTLDILERLAEDIEVVADGGECSSALAAEIACLNTAPLDESAGEGYHRSTNCERIRCAGATTEYLKQSTRFRQNLGVVNGFLRKWGRKGRQVVRFEWKRYKRVLQAARRRRWRPTRQVNKAFYQRLYRMDDKASESWSILVGKVDGLVIDDSSASGETDSQVIQREYFLSILNALTYYSQVQRSEVVGEAGDLQVVENHEFFQIVQLYTPAGRPHVIKTVQSISCVSMTAKVALFVQPLSQHALTDDGSPAVYADGDPHWIGTQDLGPFDTVRSELMEWQTVRAGDTPGLQVLSDSVHAHPRCALTDAECPTWLVLEELRLRGWMQLARGVRVHTQENVLQLVCSCGSGVTQKFYLQCLLDLPERLTFTSRMPSNQPQSYYKCLLKKKLVEAGLGDKHYLAVLKGEPPPPPAALEDEMDGGDEDPIMLADEHFAPAPAPKAKAKAKAAPPIALLPLWLPGVEDPPEPPAPLPPPIPPVVVPAPGGVLALVPDPIVVHAKAKAKAKAGPPPVPQRAPAHARDFIPAVDGGLIAYQEYTPPGGRHYSNWIIRWEGEGGQKFERKRLVTDASTRSHGAIEPLAYLHALKELIIAGDPRVAGPRAKPPQDAIDDQLVMHREAFEAIVASFPGAG